MCRMPRFLTVLRSFFHSSLLYTFSCHPSPPTILPSSLTSSCHLFLGLHLNIIVPKFTYNTFLGIIFSSILSTRQKQRNLFNLLVSIIVGFFFLNLHKFLYRLISSNFLFHCQILGLKFFYTLSIQKCSIEILWVFFLILLLWLSDMQIASFLRPYYIVIKSGSTNHILPHYLIHGTIFVKESFVHKICVLILNTNVTKNISHLQKKARYCISDYIALDGEIIIEWKTTKNVARSIRGLIRAVKLALLYRDWEKHWKLSENTAGILTGNWTGHLFNI